MNIRFWHCFFLFSDLLCAECVRWKFTKKYSCISFFEKAKAIPAEMDEQRKVSSFHLPLNFLAGATINENVQKKKMKLHNLHTCISIMYAYGYATMADGNMCDPPACLILFLCPPCKHNIFRIRLLASTAMCAFFSAAQWIFLQNGYTNITHVLRVAK